MKLLGVAHGLYPCLWPAPCTLQCRAFLLPHWSSGSRAITIQSWHVVGQATAISFPYVHQVQHRMKFHYLLTFNILVFRKKTIHTCDYFTSICCLAAAVRQVLKSLVLVWADVCVGQYPCCCLCSSVKVCVVTLIPAFGWDLLQFTSQ